MHMAYRNINYSANLRSRASVEYVADAIIIEVKPARPWECKAGQFIYLRLPELSHTAFMQAHPFFVSWWDSKTLVLLVEPRRGFTESLWCYVKEERTKKTDLIAIIEGPYGKELDFTEYETVLLFATGVGIAGQLSYLKRLMEMRNRSDTSTKRISLHWEMDNRGEKYQYNMSTTANSQLEHEDWVRKKVQNLLDTDMDSSEDSSKHVWPFFSLSSLSDNI